MDHQKLGAELARTCKWDLGDLAPVIIEALTDANFHDLADKFARLVESETGEAA